MMSEIFHFECHLAESSPQFHLSVEIAVRLSCQLVNQEESIPYVFFHRAALDLKTSASLGLSLSYLVDVYHCVTCVLGTDVIQGVQPVQQYKQTKQTLHQNLVKEKEFLIAKQYFTNFFERTLNHYSIKNILIYFNKQFINKWYFQ